MSIADLRREYNLAGLRRSDLAPEPMAQFKQWFEQARGARTSGQVRRFFIRLYKSLLLVGGAQPMDLNALTLATADQEGNPSARVVLLKAVDERGFVFYTNYASRKGRELAENPHAALVFYWADQEREVCVAGEVQKVPAAESAAYFKTRPRGSRIAAWASNQSEPIADRAALEKSWKEFERRFPGDDIPLPPGWGGFVLAPKRVEFWQGRPNRLHDRFRYTRQADQSWVIERLAP
jgi:pyridoxamine 5'-phosphate oxidase